MDRDPLPSWEDGPVKAALLDLLGRVDDVDPLRRVAVFDNDGTLWCEKPRYAQLDFLVGALQAEVARAPELADRAEYHAVLHGDMATIAELGLPRVALALNQLFEGITPEEFDDRVRTFFASAVHPTGRPYREVTYQPMVELVGAVRDAGILPVIVTGGGTEFVRAVSQDLYGVPPWHVIGTTVSYRVDDVDGVPLLHRTAEVLGEANEGDVKVSNVRLHLGVRPILAAGNSAGDARMLDHTLGADGDGLALLVDHDDADREEAYVSEAATLTAEPVLDTARRRGWLVASMRDDWRTVYA